MALGAALALAGVAGPGRAAEDAVPPPAGALPSGQEVAAHDMLLDHQGDGQVWLILRYLAPRIAREGGDLDYGAVVADLDALCAGPGRQAAAALAEGGQAPDQIVVTLMDRPVVHGEPDPAATLFIAAYLHGPEGCIWQ